MDASEKGIRFGCGSIIGFFIALGVGMQLGPIDLDLWAALAVCVVCGAVLGWLTMNSGDDVLVRICEFFRGWL